MVALVAVAMVTFMIFWMRKHARGLKRELEGSARTALAEGSVLALVAMAFFAVIREGFETAVFLLAAFDASERPVAAGGGAALGVLVAAVLGWGIYRGGVKINLARFFRVTSVVLVLVAAGLVASALHTAHEADWLTSFQTQALQPRMARRSRQRPLGAADRHARPAAAPGRGRGRRLPALRDPHAPRRALAARHCGCGSAGTKRFRRP